MHFWVHLAISLTFKPHFPKESLGKWASHLVKLKIGLIYLLTNLKIALTRLEWTEIGLNAHEGMETSLGHAWAFVLHIFMELFKLLLDLIDAALDWALSPKSVNFAQNESFAILGL